MVHAQEYEERFFSFGPRFFPFNPMQGEGRPQIDKKVIYLATLGINNTQMSKLILSCKLQIIYHIVA